MGKVTGLAHIGIMVKDLKVSKDFYMNTLGFAQDAENDLGNVVICFLSKGTCLLELVAGKPFEASGRALIDHVCMEVEGIDELVASLKEKGIVFDSEVNYNEKIRGGVKNIFFRGPDGERIEFFDYMKNE